MERSEGEEGSGVVKKEAREGEREREARECTLMMSLLVPVEIWSQSLQ